MTPVRHMVITLPRSLELALTDQARRRGISAEVLAVDALCEQFLPTSPIAGDAWEQRLFGAALDCGVTVPDSALSSDGLYE